MQHTQTHTKPPNFQSHVVSQVASGFMKTKSHTTSGNKTWLREYKLARCEHKSL